MYKGHNLIILVDLHLEEYIDKTLRFTLFAIDNFLRINTLFLLLECTYSYLITPPPPKKKKSAECNFHMFKEDC